jgi:hypothetical protein
LNIQTKAHGEADETLVRLVAREAGPTVERLADRYGVPFSAVDDFDYPGHSARRMRACRAGPAWSLSTVCGLRSNRLRRRC